MFQLGDDEVPELVQRETIGVMRSNLCTIFLVPSTGVH